MSRRVVPIELSGNRRYDIIVEPGLRKHAAETLLEVSGQQRFALICDESVADGPGGDLEVALARAGARLSCVGTIQASEQHKTMDTVVRLLQMLADAKHERHEPIIALGGGVTGDVVGFAAATYHRGAPFINIPTTLLAMVDASVGGKTGVNLVVRDETGAETLGKNLAGSFHQPAAVLIDPEFLHTLPMRHIRAGLAECVKHGVLGDAELFAWMQHNVAALLSLDGNALAELVERNVALKARVVMADEREEAASGGRALLNLGHTFGHALEVVPELDLVHGEAVGLGMIAAMHAAVMLGRCEASELTHLLALLRGLGLPTDVEWLPPAEQLLDSMRRDKKVRGGSLRLVLPTRIGEAVTAEGVSDIVTAAALHEIVRAT